MDPLGLDWSKSPGGRYNTNTSPDLQINSKMFSNIPQQQGIKIMSNSSQSTIIFPLYTPKE